jgi:DNA topoisomerase-3
MKLIITEKPSVARDIAKILKINSRHSGYFEGNGFQISWAFGHLIEMHHPDQYDPKYTHWKLHELPIIPETFQRGIIQNEGAQTQYQVISKLMTHPQTTQVICATDAGREGELIFRLIYELANCQLPVKRLWISSQTDAAIKAGFKALKPGSDYDALYASALSRSEADWLIGINATRAYTIKFSKGSGVMSIGRVQTPVLKMIIDRYVANINFVSETFYEILVTVTHPNGNFEAKWFKEKQDRLQSHDMATKVITDIEGSPDGIILNVTEKTKTENPPLLYDLTELQRDANKRYKYSADQTLKTAQALYEKHKIITYPRTSSRYLSTDIVSQLPTRLNNLSSHDSFRSYASEIQTNNWSISTRMIDNKKITDHHAIIPTEKNMNLDNLNREERHIFDLIATRFLSAFYPNCIKDHTEIITQCGAHFFKSTGTVIKQLGWRTLTDSDSNKPTKRSATKRSNTTDIILPIVLPKDRVMCQTPALKKGQTKAPPLHTESSILGAMETAGKTIQDDELRQALKACGLGTPATRAQIIERLIQVKYIERKKNTLIPTEKGHYIIQNIHHAELTSPELTGEWEQKLNSIANKTYKRSQFMTEIKAFTTKIISDLTTSSPTNAPNQTVIGECPNPDCSGKIVETPKAYSCSEWKTTQCPAVIWKTIASKLITPTIAKTLLKNGKTDTIKGFKTKNGDTFSAPLALINGKVEIKFGESLGQCPLCKSGQITQTPKAYSCSEWKKTGCKMVIWKTIAQKRISDTIAQTLIETGSTDVIDGFKSRKGDTFSAKLCLSEGKVSFQF